MAYINWSWDSLGDIVNGIKTTNEAAQAAYQNNQQRTMNDIISRNLLPDGNLNPNGTQWADAARLGLSPEQLARINDYRKGQSDLATSLAGNAYQQYIYGANPHAGDPNVGYRSTTTTPMPAAVPAKTLGDVLNQGDTSKNYSYINKDGEVFSSALGMPSEVNGKVYAPDKLPIVGYDDNWQPIYRNDSGLTSGSIGAYNTNGGESTSDRVLSYDPSQLEGDQSLSKLDSEVAPTDQEITTSQSVPTTQEQPQTGDWIARYWASVHPELAGSRLSDVSGGQSAGESYTPVINHMSVDTMSNADKIAAAKLLASKGLLNSDNYTDGDLQASLDKYVDQMSTTAGPMPMLGQTRSVSITPGKPPAITTSTDTASYNKQIQEWYAKQLSIVPQIRKELGDQYADNYKQSIDRTKLEMDIQKFSNDVKQHNADAAGMNEMAKKMSVDPTTFTSKEDLSKFGDRYASYLKLDTSKGDHTIGGALTFAKNYSVAEGLSLTDGTLELLSFMNSDPKTIAIMKLHEGSNGTFTDIGWSMAQRELAKLWAGNPDIDKIKGEMAFNDVLAQHKGSASVPTFSNNISMPANNTPGAPTSGDAGASSGSLPAPMAPTTNGQAPTDSTPKGSWFNTAGNNQFTGVGSSGTNPGNTYWVTGRDVNGIATQATDSMHNKYNIRDGGNGVTLWTVPQNGANTTSIPSRSPRSTRYSNKSKTGPLSGRRF